MVWEPVSRKAKWLQTIYIARSARYIPEAAWRNFCALRYVHNHCWVSKTDTLSLSIAIIYGLRACLEKGQVAADYDRKLGDAPALLSA